MKKTRSLTGRWLIKRTFFGFKILVQTRYDMPEIDTVCFQYEKARPEDIKELEITII